MAESDRIKKILPIHIRAMEMRLSGMSLEAIAKQIGKSHYTLNSWFYTSSLFREEFSKMKEEKIENARNILLSESERAALKIIDLKDDPKGTSVQLSAAKDILDRTIGSAKQLQEVKMSGEVTTKYGIDEKLLEDKEALLMLEKLFIKSLQE